MKRILWIVCIFLCMENVHGAVPPPSEAHPQTEKQPKSSPKDASAKCIEIVKGWNSCTGEIVPLYIYRTTDWDGSLLYMAREVGERGKPGLITDIVYCTITPPYNQHYAYCVKLTMVGAYYFNAKRISRNYRRKPAGY